MHSSIGQFQNCQPVLTLRAKPVSFLQIRNVEQVNRTSGDSRGGGGGGGGGSLQGPVPRRIGTDPPLFPRRGAREERVLAF